MLLRREEKIITYVFNRTPRDSSTTPRTTCCSHPHSQIDRTLLHILKQSFPTQPSLYTFRKITPSPKHLYECATSMPCNFLCVEVCGKYIDRRLLLLTTLEQHDTLVITITFPIAQVGNTRIGRKKGTATRDVLVVGSFQIHRVRTKNDPSSRTCAQWYVLSGLGVSIRMIHFML